MITISARATAHSEAARMKELEGCVAKYGYRAPTRADLVAGAKLQMIDVEYFLAQYRKSLGSIVCGTMIKLGPQPIALSGSNKDQEVVCYRWQMPWREGECLAPLENFHYPRLSQRLPRQRHPLDHQELIFPTSAKRRSRQIIESAFLI